MSPPGSRFKRGIEGHSVCACHAPCGSPRPCQKCYQKGHRSLACPWLRPYKGTAIEDHTPANILDLAMDN